MEVSLRCTYFILDFHFQINKKIRREVSDWDNKNAVFEDIQTEMIRKFQREFDLLEDQLEVIEGSMVGNKNRMQDSYNTLRLVLTQKQHAGLVQHTQVSADTKYSGPAYNLKLTLRLRPTQESTVVPASQTGLYLETIPANLQTHFLSKQCKKDFDFFKVYSGDYEWCTLPTQGM